MEVFKTRNYNQFKRIIGNRDISIGHVNRLVKEMKKEDLHSYDPIMVSENFEVIDGQHRLEARKELGLDVYYYISKSNGKKLIDLIRVVNSNNRNWDRKDTLNLYVAQGKEEYVFIKSFMEEYGFTLQPTLALLTSRNVTNLSNISTKTQNGTNDYNNGTFKIIDKNIAVKHANWILDFGKFYPGYKRSVFVTACVYIFKNKDYDHDRMVRKMSELTNKIINCSDSKATIRMLEEIYNYQQKVSTRVKFII